MVTENTATETVTADSTSDRLAYYCPACGHDYEYRQKCTGTLEQPHRATEVVSTDELKGDPSKFTPAPPSIDDHR